MYGYFKNNLENSFEYWIIMNTGFNNNNIFNKYIIDNHNKWCLCQKGKMILESLITKSII